MYKEVLKSSWPSQEWIPPKDSDDWSSVKFWEIENSKNFSSARFIMHSVIFIRLYMKSVKQFSICVIYQLTVKTILKDGVNSRLGSVSWPRKVFTGNV